MAVREVHQWKTSDGKSFDDRFAAEKHEEEVLANKKELVKKFLAGYSGRELLGKYNMYERGLWSVYGEDPNCDLGGPHVEPYLFTAQGELQKVIEKAVMTPRFWQWGGGGRIEKLEVIPC